MKNIVIFDLDGTIANLDHRIPLINCTEPNWDEFYAKCDQDRLNNWCVELMYALEQQNYNIYIVSGRRKDTEIKTLAWLRKHKVPYNKLVLVRENKDYTSDQKLKRNWLNTKIDKERILFVVDDRQRVVDMWRKEGLVCLQCNAWKEYKKGNN